MTLLEDLKKAAEKLAS
jgi:hypothetical protein